MKIIQIKSARLGVRTVLVDNETFTRFSRYNWSISSDGYVMLENTLRLHRLIVNAPKEMVVDHVDGNKLDNRRSNLRICTPKQNSYNRKVSCNNRSGYKGVSKVNQRPSWSAEITQDGDQMRVGYYRTPEEAALAYDAAAIQLFGDFASLNIIGRGQ